MTIVKMFIIIFILIFFSNASYTQYANFKTKYLKDLGNDYRVVMSDYINVRVEPSTASKVKLQLKITMVVKIIKESSQEVILNNIRGRWVYINTGLWGRSSDKEPIIHGWVFDHYLAKISNFKKVSAFCNCDLSWWIGDMQIKIDFFKNGTFKLINNNTYPANKKITRYLGDIYQYKNVIYLNHPQSALYNILYINKDDILCHIVTSEHDIKNRVCCKGK